MTIYEDLLALPATPSSQEVHSGEKISQKAEDLLIVDAIEARLSLTESNPLPKDDLSPLSNAMRNRRTQSTARTTEDPEELGQTAHSRVRPLTSSSQPHRRVLLRVQDIIMQIETMRMCLFPPVNPDNLSPHGVALQPQIPMSVLSIKEWESLIRVCVSKISSRSAVITNYPFSFK